MQGYTDEPIKNEKCLEESLDGIIILAGVVDFFFFMFPYIIMNIFSRTNHTVEENIYKGITVNE